jgi:hypothetical protein
MDRFGIWMPLPCSVPKEFVFTLLKIFILFCVDIEQSEDDLDSLGPWLGVTAPRNYNKIQSSCQ